MAVTSIRTSASPAEVWRVLADGWMYSNWVVGTSHMRAVQQEWPAVGSKLFHASGLWPAVSRDETEVGVSDRDRRLVVVANARPFGSARVTLDLDPVGAGTRITMTEVPCAGPGKWLHNRGADLVLKHRNDEALARLLALSERLTAPRD